MGMDKNSVHNLGLRYSHKPIISLVVRGKLSGLVQTEQDSLSP